MNGCQEAEDKAVAGHCVEHSRQRIHCAQETGGETVESADSDDPFGPSPAHLLEDPRQRRSLRVGVALVVIGVHKSLNGADAEVGEEYEEERDDNTQRNRFLRILRFLSGRGDCVEAAEC